MNKRYLERRAEFEKSFESYRPVPDSGQVFESPSGRFRLKTQRYTAGEKTWQYSRGLVERLPEESLLAGVKRNYGQFWHAWVSHPNGKEYLLCGEDYQGYTVIDLEAGKEQKYFPDNGYDGTGFCWAAAYPSPDGLVLAVEGCYWACPYEIAFYDIREPGKLPLAEVKRVDPEDISDVQGWEDDGSFAFTRQIAFRKSDGLDYDDLSEPDQDDLFRDKALYDYRYETVRVSRGDILSGENRVDNDHSE